MFKKRRSGGDSFHIHRPDYSISLITFLLVGAGLIIIYSIGSIVKFNVTGGRVDQNTYFNTQLLSLAIGTIGWVIASKLKYDFWKKIALYLFIASIITMLLVMIPALSMEAKGATRWLKLGPVNFQPVEFFKLSLILVIATWAERYKDKITSIVYGFLPFLFIVGLASVLIILLQRDMGSAMIVMAICFSMYFIAGSSIWLFVTSVFAAIIAFITLIIVEPYRFARFTTFIKKTDDISGAGYHINQALIALGSGGILGRGMGKSLQAYGYLPESINDSVFAIIGEQFGLIGTLCITILFMLLIYRFIVICLSAPDMYARLVSVGITCWIGFQALINITAMLGVIPLTGVPLPLISYGGTSMVFSLVAIGIIQNISKYTIKEKKYAISGHGRGDGRSYITGSGYARRVRKAG